LITFISLRDVTVQKTSQQK